MRAITTQPDYVVNKELDIGQANWDAHYWRYARAAGYYPPLEGETGCILMGSTSVSTGCSTRRSNSIHGQFAWYDLQRELMMVGVGSFPQQDGELMMRSLDTLWQGVAGEIERLN